MFETLTIALTGPESTGKSTLAKALAEHFECPMVEEYAREYLSDSSDYRFEDLEIIAKEQSKFWFGAILRRPKMLILDTELTVIKIWSEQKYNKVSPWIEKHYQDQKIHLYLLCDVDLEWKKDDLRENPEIEDRKRLFEIYRESLLELDRNFAVISGRDQHRLKNSIAAIDDYQSNSGSKNS